MTLQEKVLRPRGRFELAHRAVRRVGDRHPHKISQGTQEGQRCGGGHVPEESGHPPTHRWG